VVLNESTESKSSSETEIKVSRVVVSVEEVRTVVVVVRGCKLSPDVDVSMVVEDTLVVVVEVVVVEEGDNEEEGSWMASAGESESVEVGARIVVGIGVVVLVDFSVAPGVL
jgi:hypothetical protein